MSTRHRLKVGSTTILSETEWPLGLLTIYRDSERYIEPAGIDDEEELDDGVDVLVELRAPAVWIKHRLDLRGYTMSDVEAEFARSMESTKRIREQSLYQFKNSGSDELYQEESEVLNSLTLSSWLDAVSEIVKNGYGPTVWTDSSLDGLSPLLRFMLGSGGLSSLGFSCDDPLVVLRAIVEAVYSDTPVVLDMSEYVNDDEMDPEEPWCEWAKDQTGT